VFFDRRNADFKLKAFVDFVLLELGQLGVEAVDVVPGRHLLAKIRKIVLGRHVLDDMGEYLSNLFEGGFLWCNTPRVYHADRSGARVR
jgi:hypothetical protein